MLTEKTQIRCWIRTWHNHNHFISTHKKSHNVSADVKSIHASMDRKPGMFPKIWNQSMIQWTESQTCFKKYEINPCFNGQKTRHVFRDVELTCVSTHRKPYNRVTDWINSGFNRYEANACFNRHTVNIFITMLCWMGRTKSHSTDTRFQHDIQRMPMKSTRVKSTKESTHPTMDRERHTWRALLNASICKTFCRLEQATGMMFAMCFVLRFFLTVY